MTHRTVKQSSTVPGSAQVRAGWILPAALSVILAGGCGAGEITFVDTCGGCSGHGYCLEDEGSADVAASGSPICICEPGYVSSGPSCVEDLSLGGSTYASQSSSGEGKKYLDRYWTYRSRLRTQYMVLGLAQGYSVPAASLKRGVSQGKKNMKLDIKWADGTTYLGWYVATLATEHYMLSNPGLFPGFEGSQSRTAALKLVELELFHALAALERLDRWAESSFKKDAPDTRGFFMRDDVNQDFFFGSKLNEKYLWFGSDFVAQDNRDKEMSQDQVIHLLFGLAFVHKLIPPSVVVKGVHLLKKATKLAVPMVELMTTRRPSCSHGCTAWDCIDVGLSHSERWLIVNPVTHTLVKRGYCADHNVGGLVKAMAYLTNKTADFSSYAKSGHWNKWKNLADGSNLFQNPDNLHLAMAISSLSETWDKGGTLKTMDVLMNLVHYSHHGYQNGWYAYPLANAVLVSGYLNNVPDWPKYKVLIAGEVKKMLYSAPTDGPHPPLGSHAHPGWSSSHRFLRDGKDQLEGNQHGQEVFYNGLDFTLLHNLYYLAMPEIWKS